MSDKKVKPKKKDKSVFTKKSSAGKGDTPRIGITLDEWEKKYEKIFGKKKESIRSHRTDNIGSKS